MVAASRLICASAFLLLTGCAELPADFLARPKPVEVVECKRMPPVSGPDTRGTGTVDPTGCSFLMEGKASFRRADYGLAEMNFRKAVEAFSVSQNGVRNNYLEALLGLAATYDALKRFDMADQIYGTIAQMAPDSPEYNNNYGYSLLLRGEAERAKPYFEKARKLAPANSIIQNNSQLI